jgi:hypothetical protein
MMRGALAMWGWTTRHWVEGGLVSSVVTIAALLIFENSHAAEPTPTVLAPSAIVVTLPTPFPAATEASR